jgi:hypothetical protein
MAGKDLLDQCGPRPWHSHDKDRRIPVRPEGGVSRQKFGIEGLDLGADPRPKIRVRFRVPRYLPMLQTVRCVEMPYCLLILAEVVMSFSKCETQVDYSIDS